ncbi:Alpha/Beta hydrolase protein [Lobosporangium transversale]|uniref:Alpha/Beta hydrolase protein n=1 Tax=Lobosporangium transversale TaxID=64571 RepID=A0A1Y2GG31_9FUNG|nr:Alpha/Beta hydrolase protein [Lobosporangium transversale]ORZ08541.1 Alpha/Beta hydrolase protein [Lobosporangium transversale]|eukprot:XP_021878469.1 Alpha/Beta hydrolase protein [Lobosporangium transversale]
MKRQVEHFAKNPEYTTVFFDNRGVGHSDAPRGLYATSQMAQDTIDLMDALGWTQGVHVAGVSMGGMIALELVLADPKRFSSLLLTSTNAGRSPPQLVTVSFLSRVVLLREPHARIKLICETLYPTKWLDSPAPKDSGYKTNREMSAASLKRRFANTPVQPIHGNIAQCWAALFHHVNAKRLAQIRESGLPVLVVTGTEDNFVRPSGSYHLAKEIGAPLVVFEGSGHALPMEQTETYCKFIEELVDNGKNGAFELAKGQAL